MNEQWLVDILEKFRERCAEEGDAVEQSNEDRDQDGYCARVTAKRVREIDVKAWLASARKGG